MTQAANPTKVRWRESGWEYRCDSCARKAKSARFWPLTEEFWNRTRMSRCRACWAELNRANNRKVYRENPGFRDRARVRNRETWAATRSDPIALNIAREKGRLASKRYRDRQKAA